LSTDPQTRSGKMGSLRSSNNEKNVEFELSPKTRYHEIENPRFRNLRKEAQGAPITWCSNCKKKSHNHDHCWFLHPNLRPKQRRRGRDHQEKKNGHRERGRIREQHNSFGYNVELNN
jgi:hypothetical protein